MTLGQGYIKICFQKTKTKVPGLNNTSGKEGAYPSLASAHVPLSPQRPEAMRHRVVPCPQLARDEPAKAGSRSDTKLTGGPKGTS